MISLPMLRSILGSSGDGVSDAELVLARDGAVGMLEEMTGRLWARRVGYTELVDVAVGTKTLYPRLYPVETLAAAEWADGSVEADAVAVAASELVLDAAGGSVYRSAGWSRFVRLTVTGGYSEAAAPPACRLVLARQIQYGLARNRPGVIAVESLSVPDGGTTRNDRDAFHPDFAAFVERNRRLVL